MRSDSLTFSFLVVTLSVETYKSLLQMCFGIVVPYHICIKGNWLASDAAQIANPGFTPSTQLQPPEAWLPLSLSTKSYYLLSARRRWGDLGTLSCATYFSACKWEYEIPSVANGAVIFLWLWIFQALHYLYRKKQNTCGWPRGLRFLLCQSWAALRLPQI